jgi:hypothetical protein
MQCTAPPHPHLEMEEIREFIRRQMAGEPGPAFLVGDMNVDALAAADPRGPSAEPEFIFSFGDVHRKTKSSRMEAEPEFIFSFGDVHRKTKSSRMEGSEEYRCMVQTLSDGGQMHVRDVLYEEEGRHPCTFGIPSERVLTVGADRGVPQRLDYVFELHPRVNTSPRPPLLILPVCPACRAPWGQVLGCGGRSGAFSV